MRAGRRPDNRRHERVILPVMGFAALGMFSFGLTCIALVVRPDALLGDPGRGSVVALTHVATLGWIGSLLFAGSYLFGPVLTGAPLWSARIPAWHLVCHVSGLGMLAGGLLAKNYSVAGFGGVLTVVGLGLLVVNLQMTGNRRSLWNPAHLTFQSALFWLAVTGGVALYVLRSRLTGEAGIPVSILIALHAHVALFGFLTQALLGVSLRMVPRLLGRPALAKIPQPWAWGGWFALNAGRARSTCPSSGIRTIQR